LRSVFVEIDLDASGPKVGRLDYYFGTRKGIGSHCFVKLDNRNLRYSILWGQGPGPEPFGDRSIDVQNITLGIDDALRIAQARGGSKILNTFPTEDIQLGLLLSAGELRAMGGHPQHSAVWAVSYDVWGSSGPQGFLQVEIDALNGDLVQVIDDQVTNM
jgi:hypothetical protein